MTSLQESLNLKLKKDFKILTELLEQDSMSTSFDGISEVEANNVLIQLNNAVIETMLNSGSRSYTGDSSSGDSTVKFSSFRMNFGENSSTAITSGDGSQLLNVSLSSTALSSIRTSSSSGYIEGNSVMLSTFTSQFDESAIETAAGANLFSDVYSINVVQTDGTSSSMLSVSGLADPIRVSIQMNGSSFSGSFEIRSRTTGSSDNFAVDADINATLSVSSTGLVTFETTHLTDFAVFESDTGATVTGGGGGGGCLLK